MASELVQITPGSSGQRRHGRHPNLQRALELVQRVPLILVVVGLAVMPLILVFITAFRDEARFGLGDSWSLEALQDVYGSDKYYRLFGESVRLAAPVTVVAVVLGTMLAWLTARTDMPLRRLHHSLMLLPLMTSPFVGAIAWADLGSRRTGYLNTILGSHIDIYTFWGIAWILTLYYTPFVYFFTVGSLKRIDASLEEAAQSSGAGLPRTLTRIIIPVASPAIATAAIFVFVLCIETYTIPAVFGTPAGYSNLALQIYRDAHSSPQHLAHAAAAATLVLAVTVSALQLQRRSTKRAARFRTISGRGFGTNSMRLGRVGWLFSVLFGLYIVLAAFMPYVSLIFSSLAPYPGAPLEELTVANYERIFDDPFVIRAITNSLLVSLVVAVGATLLGILISRADVGKQTSRQSALRLGRLIGILGSTPLAVPGVILGLAFLLFALRTPIYGSIAILAAMLIAKHMPYGINIARSGFLQIGGELEEAASLVQSRSSTILYKITLPLLGPSIMASLLFVFALAVKELAASIFVATNQSIVLPVLVWQYMVAGETRVASALGIIEIGVVLLTVALARLGFRVRLEENF